MGIAKTKTENHTLLGFKYYRPEFRLIEWQRLRFSGSGYQKVGKNRGKVYSVPVYFHMGWPLICTCLGKTPKYTVEGNGWKAETGISVGAHCMTQSLEFEFHEIKAAW